MTATIAPELETKFTELGLNPLLVETLTALGYQEPTPIQRQAIPPLLEGRDFVGQAATGTGKTAAFALPLLHRLAELGTGRARPSALVLVPTRELAMQVAEAVQRYGRILKASVMSVCGGQAFAPQLRQLKQGVDIVVATPGRAHDLLRRGTLRLNGVSAVVLDEADEMLDLGFAEDLEALLSQTPKDRQTMLFSATLSERVVAIARRHLTNPLEIRAVRERVEAGSAPRVRQTAYVVDHAHKAAALGRVLDLEVPAAALVFCRTRTEVDELTATLGARGYRPEALHGGMSQEHRDRVMRLFRAGSAGLLIATDVAARGLDIDHLSHVVNYHLPGEVESYVHRIGRVGRAGREGVVVNLAEPRELRLLRNIERTTGQKIDVLPLPTVADLRVRRLELTRDSLRSTILAGDLDQFREVVQALAGEFDIQDIALAAVKLAHQAGSGARNDSAEIPSPRSSGRSEWPEQEREKPYRRDARGREPAMGMGRIFIGVGREAGISPRDLVGAIANEAGVPGRDIRGIDIADRFSLVDVPEEAVDYVIDSLQGARIRGRKVLVRRDRGQSDRV